MSRYIDIENFLDKIINNKGNIIHKCDLIALAANQTTADIIEVVHGEWIEKKQGFVIVQRVGIVEVLLHKLDGTIALSAAQRWNDLYLYFKRY